eukprot:2710239-Amphidinium_carterae.1
MQSHIGKGLQALEGLSVKCKFNIRGCGFGAAVVLQVLDAIPFEVASGDASVKFVEVRKL